MMLVSGVDWLIALQLLALHAALRVLAMDELAICHWLDTEGSFPPDRAKAVLESWDVDVSGIVAEQRPFPMKLSKLKTSQQRF
jgi:hypothetical protein